MLRTRDFILFLLVLFFLGTAITATIVRGTDDSTDGGVVVFTDIVYQGEAVSSGESLDRQSIISRLRAKLANSTERIEPSASVEAPEPTEVEIETGIGLQKCLFPDDALSLVPKWPLADVQVTFEGGVRMAYIEELIPEVLTTSSSSVAIISEPVAQSLLTMPLIPQKLSESVCVPSEVIGITNKGILIFNGDVNTYRNIPQDSLVGFARDGFPIFGVYSGEVDQCGGYDHPAGYRYTVSTERDYIIGCYVATPAKFSL